MQEGPRVNDPEGVSPCMGDESPRKEDELPRKEDELPRKEDGELFVYLGALDGRVSGLRERLRDGKE